MSAPAYADLLPGPPDVLDGTKYVYGLRLNGVPAARADADFNFEESERGRTYGLNVVGRTLPIIRLVYPVTSRMEAQVGADRRPLTYNLWRRHRRSDRETRYEFDPAANTVQILRTKGNETVQEAVVMGEGLLDPAALLLQAYGLASTLGGSQELQLLLEGTVYRLEVEVVEREERRVLGHALPSFCLAATAHKIKDDGTEEAVTKIRNIRMWFSDDDLRLPLSIAATAPFGRITVQLAKVTPSLDSLYAEMPPPQHAALATGRLSTAAE